MSAKPWYRRYGHDFITETIGMSFEDKSAFSLLIDLAASYDGAIPSDARYIAGTLGISVRRWGKIRSRLLEAGKIHESIAHIEVPILGRWAGQAGRQYIPKQVRDAVFERDGNQCSYCPDDVGPFHLDHIVPVVLGGTNAPENLTVACAKCNLSKGAKPLGEWLQ